MTPTTEKTLRDLYSVGKAALPIVICVASAIISVTVWVTQGNNDKSGFNDRLKNHEEMINELKSEMKGQRMYIDTRLNDISRDIQSGNQLTAKMSGQMEILLRRQGVTP